MHKQGLGKGGQNRQKIVQAADELFYRQGYNATSFTDIANAAQVPRGNFYYYFKSKDELLRSVVQRRLESLREMLARWDREPGARAQLLAFARMPEQRAEEMLRYGCPFGSLNVELSKTQRELQAEAAGLFDALLDWLVPKFEALGRGAEARELALHLMARIQGLILVANACRDSAFLRAEVARLQAWVEAL